MIVTKGSYGSELQHSKQYSASTTAGSTIAVGFPNSTPIFSPRGNGPIRVFKVEGVINQLTGNNPTLQLMDKAGNVFFEHHGIVGTFSFTWDHPGARAVYAYDGTNPEIPTVQGPIYLNIQGSTKVDLWLKVEAFEVVVA
jgi:hypothetical protein